MKRLSKNALGLMVTTGVFIVINALAWVSPSWVDLYHRYVYNPVSRLFSHVTGVVSVSIGEFMIMAGLLLLAAAPFALVIPLVKKQKRTLKIAGSMYAWVLVFILGTETLNCFVLYHTTELPVKLSAYAAPEGYTAKQLVDYCEEVIDRANELSLEVPRDEQGEVMLPDLHHEAQKAFEKASGMYPELYGYVPPPKGIMNSWLMCQTDLQGIYFPFSLEGNYNTHLSPARTPCTVFHELCHVKGFIREDEATYLACVLCMESDDPAVQYSGYITAMNYLFAEAKKHASEEDIYALRCRLSAQVAKDNYFVKEEYMKKVEEKSPVSNETASAASQKAMDTTLRANGITDGKHSYGRCVTLLLIYRYGITA
ncbi:MAG: DUF3810 domain-containing protein [Oscillospiraceae bacterium]|nr:DUF3810 domain-containing protein [Oscillospiraceae bacterium]